MTEYTPPELGSIEVSIYHLTSMYFVLVKKFKRNTLRGDSCWVCVNKLCRQFKTREAAENYAKRVNSLEK